MSKPDWCPQRVWMDVGELFHTVANNHHAWGALEQLSLAWKADLEESIARAILAAENRGEEREREACAKIAETGFWGVEPESPGALVSKGVWRGLDAQGISSAIRARSIP